LVSGTDVFLSYSREDRAAARHIAESFAAEGISVWWDAALQSGQTFDEVIEQRLKEALAVVVLWSPRSVTSRWVRAEATLADRKNKLVPAIIEACDRPIAFELTHTADLSSWTGDIADPTWRRFVQDVRRLIDQAKIADQPVAAEAKPRSFVPARERRIRPAPPVSRERLVPGNDDVIFAAAKRRNEAQSAEKPVAAAAVPAIIEDEADEFHCLRVTDGMDSEDVFVVGPSGLRIGRKAPADAVIAHASVSREHCMVGLANDELLVSDLSSTNGTYIDEQRIGRSAVLPVGSVLRVGQVSLTHEVLSREEALQWIDPASAGRRGGTRPARFATAP
jgi:pSer/pThr/pTyr-binding forkhead associated (FHA) protein